MLPETLIALQNFVYALDEDNRKTRYINLLKDLTTEIAELCEEYEAFLKDHQDLLIEHNQLLNKTITG